MSQISEDEFYFSKGQFLAKNKLGPCLTKILDLLEYLQYLLRLKNEQHSSAFVNALADIIIILWRVNVFCSNLPAIPDCIQTKFALYIPDSYNRATVEVIFARNIHRNIVASSTVLSEDFQKAFEFIRIELALLHFSLDKHTNRVKNNRVAYYKDKLKYITETINKEAI